MSLAETFQQGGAAIFTALGDLVQSMTLTDAAGATYSVSATMVEAKTLSFPPNVAAGYQNGALVQGYGLAVTPKKNWKLTDANGKKWRICEVSTDPAGALHQCLIECGGA